jgi:asparagine synthase (glutamine-hydrolysing)
MVGEGPDEVCSSYLFNYYAPSGEALHNCAKEYVERIHMYDGRRADRCISRWSLEGRVALLDPEFISTYWSIPDSWRMPVCSLSQFGFNDKPIEKFWLRKAFDETNVIPNDVLWRKKEAFSDGVSSKEKSWYEIIQEHIETLVSDEEFINNKEECVTKEQYYYKKVFIEFFGHNRLSIIPGYWLPKWSADGQEVKEYIDPSARVLKVYNNE